MQQPVRDGAARPLAASALCIVRSLAIAWMCPVTILPAQRGDGSDHIRVQILVRTVVLAVVLVVVVDDDVGLYESVGFIIRATDEELSPILGDGLIGQAAAVAG